VITNNYIKNASYAIYGDSFANQEGTLIEGNVIEQASEAGIYLRPNDHHEKVIITNNVITGGGARIGIGVDPLSMKSDDPPVGWLNTAGDKIWIEDVTIANNTMEDKQLLIVQTRGAKVVNNTAGSGGFYLMDGEAVVCRGNRTPAGGIPLGLEDDPSR
jgi:Right handed beta helix region